MTTKFRRGTTIAGGFAAAALAVGMASPVASAQNLEGPVKFWAAGNEQCEVEFTVLNSTNGEYILDWWVEGQDKTGENFGLGPTGQIIESRNYEPTASYDVTPPVRYQSDFDVPLTTNVVYNLDEVEGLPDSEDGEYVVNYRMASGIESDHRGDPDGYTTTVTGCETEDEGTGSLSLGSLDVFGSLGS